MAATDSQGEHARGGQALAAAGLSLEALKAALRAEETARLSSATQAAYGEAESGAHGTDGSWLEVTDALQQRVLTELGVPPDRMAAALFVLRAASQLFPDDAELRQLPLYVRHNRAQLGTLRPGDALPDVPLFSPDATGAATTLREACDGPQPTLVVAGSWT